MHFHHAVINHFASTYGANFLTLLKPSPQNEAWVGFDQGWAYTSLSANDLFTSLQGAIKTSSTSIEHFYLGYFLQFKKVTLQSRKSKYVPNGFPTPHYRSELSLSPNQTTGLSQHETLLRLRDIQNASVSYACAMLFNLSDIYKPASLDDLRCVPLASAPSGWATNEKHFILFRDKNDQTPLWLSDPVEAVSYSFREWASPQAEHGPKKLGAAQIIELIETAARELMVKEERSGIPTQRDLFQKREGEREAFVRSAGLMPENFTLIEFAQTDEPKTLR